MSLSPALLVVPAVPVALLLNGYAVTMRFTASSAAERLAIALLAGLSVLLFNWSVANFFLPLTPSVAAVCAWPVLLTFALRGCIQSLATDLRTVIGSSRGRVAAVLSAASIVLLISPELRRDNLLYYDGTGSHDGYFWISGAKRLQSHSYMDVVERDLERPWANMTNAFTGWTPNWGRAGAENLLAATAALSFRDPVEIYLPATAGLFFAWIAAVFLVIRAFWLSRLTLVGVATLSVLHPLFVFFRANANLPNLLGALCAAAGFVAFARALRDDQDRTPWLALLVLSVHGVTHSYPELLPFVAISCSLLLARAFFQRRTATLLAPLIATLGGFTINPATTIRAYYGFVHSFNNARLDVDWVNTFTPLHIAQYAPALATLSIPSVLFVGPVVCAILAIALVLALWFSLRAAHDRFAVIASLSGGALLILYTVATDFSYGWQKAAQFSAVFLAAALPCAALQNAFASIRRPVSYLLFPAIGALVAATFALAIVFHLLELHKWSTRKTVTTSWIQLRDFSARHLRDAQVRVEPATFRTSFFHSMWATYFLAEARLIFPDNADRPGGYLQTMVATAADHAIPPPAAFLIGPDAPAPRDTVPLLLSPDFQLLRPTNIGLPQAAP